MKYLFPLLVLSVLFLGAVSVELPDGSLVAHYTFDDCSAKDKFGQSNGIERGRPDCGCGVSGSAMYFDGIDDFVSLTGRVNDVFGTNDFTVSYYFKTYDNSARQIFLSNRLECDQENAFFEMKHLQACGDFGPGRIWSEVSNTMANRAVSVSVLPETRWSHVTLVRKDNELILYLNGYEHDRRKASKGVVDLSGSGQLSIAYSPCAEAGVMNSHKKYFPFQGAMDELRVYKKALDENEVKMLYDAAPVGAAELDCAS